MACLRTLVLYNARYQRRVLVQGLAVVKVRKNGSVEFLLDAAVKRVREERIGEQVGDTANAPPQVTPVGAFNNLSGLITCRGCRTPAAPLRS